MNKINYKEKIELKETIEELLMINIDENINKVDEENFISFIGNIEVSGEAKTISKNTNFNHQIDLDISLSKEKLLANNPSISVEDFSYSIDDNFINLDITLKIEGLKEIENEVIPQEDEEIIQPPLMEMVKEELLINDVQIDMPSSLLTKIFKRGIKTEKAYLLHVVKEETTYEEIASLYNIETDTLKKSNVGKEIKQGNLIFIPNKK